MVDVGRLPAVASGPNSHATSCASPIAPTGDPVSPFAAYTAENKRQIWPDYRTTLWSTGCWEPRIRKDKIYWRFFYLFQRVFHLVCFPQVVQKQTFGQAEN